MNRFDTTDLSFSHLLALATLSDEELSALSTRVESANADLTDKQRAIDARMRRVCRALRAED